MELGDVPRVAEIQVFAWRTSDRGIISDEYLFRDMTVVKRIDYYKNLLINCTDENYVFDDGIIKAFITISKCKDEDMPDSPQLSSIYVEPFFQRNGIGSQMIKYFEDIALQRGFSRVCLWVMKKNDNAISFYEKLGYAPDGTEFTGGLGTTEIRYIKMLCFNSSSPLSSPARHNNPPRL